VPTQRGACAAYLECVDDYNRKATRIISEPVGNSTNPQCDLKAAILGLMSVKADPVLRHKVSIELFASSYVAPLLERKDDGYKINPKKNVELVRRLREKAELFGNLTVRVGLKEQLQTALDVANGTVSTGVGIDSDTKVL
jgi:ribonuclease HI